MKLPNSTYEILIDKYLGNPIDSKWISWSIDMLEEGYDSENLRIMAGMSEQENHFVLSQYAENIIVEMKLDWTDYKLNLIGFINYSHSQYQNNVRSVIAILRDIKDLYLDSHWYELCGFSSLYYAIDDLENNEEQWYVYGLTRENTNAVIEGYFQQWLNSDGNIVGIVLPSKQKEVCWLNYLNIFSIFKK